jgi:hypothetical protein
MMSTVEQYPNALTHAGSKGVHSPEIYNYLHAKMKEFHDKYQLNLKSSDTNVKDTAKQKFKNDIEVFLKDVGRSFLQDDEKENRAISDTNREIRQIVQNKLNSKTISIFCPATPTP